MLRIILKILTFSLPFFVNPAYTQEIWKENFSIPGKGIWGNENGTIQSDFSGITTWTIDTVGVHLTGSGDYAKTVGTSGGRFECRDIDGEVVWRSEKIDISAFSKVNIRLTAYETGSGNNHETKYLKAFYRLNEGSEMPFSTNGENTGNWGSVQVEELEVEGKNLQIICYLVNYYANDKVTLDEVIVWKKEEPLPPVNKHDVIITEILFNPFPGGDDFVEIYNLSEKCIGLNRLSLANRKKNLELNQIYQLSKEKYCLYPKSYVALTKDTNNIFSWYSIDCPECFLQMDKMPSFNNDEGYVVLLNENMEVIDELFYNEKMHSPFFNDPEGVSLERVSFSAPANAPNNWHSASTDSGYGTPGYENSQANNEDIDLPMINFEPEAFSPNLDGFNDEYLIHYTLNKPGYVANIKLFDTAGRFVLALAKNKILGISGTVIWNGEDETGQRQPIGVYIVVVEIFNDQGNVYRFKDAVVLTDILE